MPGIDGTGPRSRGPMTGRGMGSCILRFEPGEPRMVTGFSGAAGRPVQWSVEQQKENRIMPGGNRTGPMGMGAMTGRGAGFCTGNAVPGYMSPGGGRGAWGGGGRWGRGQGFGFRGGRGWGGAGVVPQVAPYGAAGFAGPSPEQERTMLQGQIEQIEDALAGIRKRLSELEPADGSGE